MAQPARKTPHGEDHEPVPELEDDDVVTLQRWIERPDGNLELLERPLTPEDFLDPQLEDKTTQGRPHADTTLYLTEIVKRHFSSQPDVVVLMDVKHLFGPGFNAPSPDVSVLRGVPRPDRIQESFDYRKIGVLPCLIIEVVSPKDRRIRRVDEEDKVRLYQRVGIPEYLLILPPRRNRPGQRFGLWGYRLGPNRRYRPIEPDGNGRLLSETTGLQFAVSPDGDRIDVFNSSTGERFLTPVEIEEELQRLRAELQRLKPDR
ncbi:MAG TPA: Uma2 family endonuclease [Thermoanaerobaculia bacterium]|nr:Uma2 family endonuclease [Thermoanaerobaculia bacterium]